ncbi:hypothetical protein AB6D11_17890 [Vibrio splendidus]
MSLKATSDTGWVKPINQITGLDHLGVQAPCIEVYGKLLPGITNVTDRARYYSFYAWVFYAFERKKWLDSDTFLKMFRRADCLFTLAAMAHETSDDGTVNHSGALVGKDTFQNSKTSPQGKNSSYRNLAILILIPLDTLRTPLAA